MLNTQDKRDVIYALEEWTKTLEQEGNIAKRNEVMELTWKVSSSLGKEMSKCHAYGCNSEQHGDYYMCEYHFGVTCGDHLVAIRECGCQL